MIIGAAITSVIITLGLGAPSKIDPELKCLAEAIYFESRAEPLKGKIGVTNVVVNRTKDEDFPDSACAVIKQAKQFSYRNKGKALHRKHRVDLSKPKVRAALEAVVLTAWLSRTYGLKDVTGGATHFVNKSIARPLWLSKYRKVAQIGAHSFYKPNS